MQPLLFGVQKSSAADGGNYGYDFAHSSFSLQSEKTSVDIGGGKKADQEVEWLVHSVGSAKQYYQRISQGRFYRTSIVTGGIGATPVNIYRYRGSDKKLTNSKLEMIVNLPTTGNKTIYRLGLFEGTVTSQNKGLISKYEGFTLSSKKDGTGNDSDFVLFTNPDKRLTGASTYIKGLGNYTREYPNKFQIGEIGDLAGPINDKCKNLIVKPVGNNPPEEITSVLEILSAPKLKASDDQEIYNKMYKQGSDIRPNEHFSDKYANSSESLAYFEEIDQEFSLGRSVADVNQITGKIMLPIIGETEVSTENVNKVMAGLTTAVLTIVVAGKITSAGAKAGQEVVAKKAVAKAAETSAGQLTLTGLEGEVGKKTFAQIIKDSKVAQSVAKGKESIKAGAEKAKKGAVATGASALGITMGYSAILAGLNSLSEVSSSLYNKSGKYAFSKLAYAKYYIEKHQEYHQCVLDQFASNPNLKNTPEGKNLISMGFTQEMLDDEKEQILSATENMVNDALGFKASAEAGVGETAGETSDCPLEKNTNGWLYAKFVAGPICAFMGLMISGAANISEFAIRGWFIPALGLQ